MLAYMAALWVLTVAMNLLWVALWVPGWLAKKMSILSTRLSIGFLIAISEQKTKAGRKP